jgi:hypothetical protein
MIRGRSLLDGICWESEPKGSTHHSTLSRGTISGAERDFTALFDDENVGYRAGPAHLNVFFCVVYFLPN